jgi:hypothetical protein
MFNILNYYQHPTRPGHTIFRFHEKERADFFRELLLTDNIWHETDSEESQDRTTYFFGVKNGDIKTVNQKNYLVSAKFRNPLIPNIYFRWGIIIFAVAVITLAIVGAIIKT